MSEASFEMVLNELREAAPPAPERLRGLVRSLPAATPRFSLRIRPAISAAIVTMLVVGIGVSIYAGLRGDPAGQREPRATSSARRDSGGSKATTGRNTGARAGRSSSSLAPQLTAKSRLQKTGRRDEPPRGRPLRRDPERGAHDSTPRRLRRRRRLCDGSKDGNSRLALRVPVANLQKAIASFTHLGTILSQHISVADLQGGLDRLDARIAKARHAGHARTVARLERRRDALIREGTYARVVAPADDRQACGEKRGARPVRPLPGYVGRHSG